MGGSTDDGAGRKPAWQWALAVCCLNVLLLCLMELSITVPIVSMEERVRLGFTAADLEDSGEEVSPGGLASVVRYLTRPWPSRRTVMDYAARVCARSTAKVVVVAVIVAMAMA